QVVSHLERGGRIDSFIWQELRYYAIFHGLLATLCCGLSMLRVRSIALREVAAPLRKRWLVRTRRRPNVGNQPVLWKELHTSRVSRRHWIGTFLIILLFIASFLPVISIFIQSRAIEYRDPWKAFTEEMNIWARTTGTAVGSLVLLAAAVGAAGSISGER